MNRRSLTALLVCFVACRVNVRAPVDTLIECRSSNDCSDDRVCVIGLDRCMAPGAACVLGRDGEYVVAPDGNGCGSESQICVGGACVTSACGDGFTDALRGETCDAGAANGDDPMAACRATCSLPRCGDGILDASEQCDDGNASDADSCLATCVFNRCGDGFVETGEEACDDGDADNADACLATCALNVCGDGFRNPSLEACDDGNASDDDGCVAGCVPAGCGDGFVRAGVEACDDGNTSDADLCRGDCKKVHLCGDGIKDAPEACDDGDGDLNDNDGCTHCENTEWIAALVTGAGAAAGDPRAQNFQDITAVTSDIFGAVYIAADRRIWRIDNKGKLTAYVGDGVQCASAPCGTGGPAALARLDIVSDLATDPFGDLYIAEGLNNWEGGASTVRRVDRTTGIISVYAGAPGVSMGSGGPLAANTGIGYPRGIGFDRLGNLYIADALAHLVWRVARSTGTITAPIGSGTLCPTLPCADGLDNDAEFKGPTDVAVGNDGAVFISDQSAHAIRMSRFGSVTTIAGNGTPCPGPSTAACGTDGVGAATGATLDRPGSVIVLDDANILFADIDNYRVRRLEFNTKTLRAFAGDGNSCLGSPSSCGDGGAPTAAKLDLEVTPGDARGLLDLTRDGRVLIADAALDTIREVNLARTTIQSIAGVGPDATDDPSNLSALSVNLKGAANVVVAPDGGIIASIGARIVRIDPTSGVVSLVAGDGFFCLPPYTGECGEGLPAQQAHVSAYTLAFSPSGELYFVDFAGGVAIRKIALDGTVRRVAGVIGPGCWVGPCGDNGPPLSASFAQIESLAFDTDENLYIADAGQRRVRRIDAAFTTIVNVAGGAPLCTTGPCGDGAPAVSGALADPAGIAVDMDGSLLIADRWQHRVRRAVVGGNISAVAGTGAFCSPATGSCGDGGPASDAAFTSPQAVVVGPSGVLYVADKDGNRVRKIAGGIISTIAGDGNYCPATSCGDGGTATGARFAEIVGLTLDNGGKLLALEKTTPLSVLRRIDDVANTIRAVGGGIDLPADGALSDASLTKPHAIVRLPSDEFLLACETGGNGRIKRVREGATSLLDTVIGYPGQTAIGPSARFSRLLNEPGAMVFDPSGIGNGGVPTLYLAEAGGNVIHRLTLVTIGAPSTWTMEVFAGTGVSGAFNGPPRLSSTFSKPTGVALDPVTGTLYVTDRGSHLIRAISLQSDVVTTIAGTQDLGGFFGEGADGLDAVFNAPEALVVDPGVALYVADTLNHRVRRIDLTTPAHHVSTVLGDGVPTASGEGAPANTFSIASPRGLARDTAGNIWATGGSAVRVLIADADGRVDGNGEVHTVYGRAPRNLFPGDITNCLAGVALSAAEDRALIADECLGLVVELVRTIKP